GVGVGVAVEENGLVQCSVSVLLPNTPTAHASLPLPLTPSSSLLPLPTLGLGTTDHALPSQCSVSVWVLGKLPTSPTAHTSLPLPVAALRIFSFGSTLGLGTTDQALPSQCRIRVG